MSSAAASAISRLGVEYDAAWDHQDAGYGTDTLALEKVLNELELKRAFLERLLGLLTREQREVIVDPGLHDTYPYDLYSPLLLLAGKIEPLVEGTREETRKSIEKVFIDHHELSEEQVRAAGPAFDAWLAQVEPLLAAPLTSRALHRMYFFTGVEGLAAGRAQTSLMKEILASLPPDAAARSRILATTKLYLPRLLE